jgi:hypothetical protein
MRYCSPVLFRITWVDFNFFNPYFFLLAISDKESYCGFLLRWSFWMTSEFFLPSFLNAYICSVYAVVFMQFLNLSTVLYWVLVVSRQGRQPRHRHRTHVHAFYMYELQFTRSERSGGSFFFFGRLRTLWQPRQTFRGRNNFVLLKFRDCHLTSAFLLLI